MSRFQTIVYADAQTAKTNMPWQKKRCIRRCLMIFSCTSRREYFFHLFTSGYDAGAVYHTDQNAGQHRDERRAVCLMETVIQRANRYNSQWELGYIHGERYIYRYLWFQDTCLGACVSEKQLLEILGEFSLQRLRCVFQTGESGEENISERWPADSNPLGIREFRRCNQSPVGTPV